MSIYHKLVSSIADNPLHPGWVRPKDWNAEHEIENGTITNDYLTGNIEDDKLNESYLKADGSRELTADWDAGDYKITAKNFEGWGIVPIGGVIAWLKSFTGTPSLPDGYVECNGQVLNDAASVYNGRTMPQLNGYGGAGTNRFLRGSATSGSTGGTESHRHDVLNYNPGFSLGLVYYYTIRSIYTYYAIAIPPYYEVVYVMRVK